MVPSGRRAAVGGEVSGGWEREGGDGKGRGEGRGGGTLACGFVDVVEFGDLREAVRVL